MGFATAVDMAKRGARVIMACRNMEKGMEALEKVVRESGSENVILKTLDLASFESIHYFAKDINETEERIDVLINNAGVSMCPHWKSEDGFELQFATNHLGPFLLTNLLLDLIKKSSPSRIVTVASSAHYPINGARIYWDDMNMEKNYTPVNAYCQTKLMNVLFSRELSNRLQGTGVTSYSLEPGFVKTGLQCYVGTHEHPTFSDRMMSLITTVSRRWWKTPEQGAQTQIYCAVAPELVGESGKYYGACKVKRESSDARRDDYAKRLWEASEQFTGLAKPPSLQH